MASYNLNGAAALLLLAKRGAVPSKQVMDIRKRRKKRKSPLHEPASVGMREELRTSWRRSGTQIQAFILQILCDMLAGAA